MKEKYLLGGNIFDDTNPLGQCEVCGGALFDGDEIYLTRDRKLPVGCGNCVIAALKKA